MLRPPHQKVDVFPLWMVFLLLAAALTAGWITRFEALGQRPMHTDEAVHGLKLEAMLRTGYFDYDPSDYHGSTLHQATAMLGRIFQVTTYDAATLRSVSALFGWLCLLALIPFRRSIGWEGAGAAVLLAAFSPMLLFYSRYYIMEALLALELLLFLNFLQASVKGPTLWTALGMGVCAGLMHATKETFILFVGPLLVAAWLCGLVKTPGRFWRLEFGLLAFVVVSGLFITSFGRHWEDWPQSYRTYALYGNRASQPGFEQPWHYYLSLIFYRDEGLVWTEAFTAALGVIGAARAWVPGGRTFLRCLSLGLLVSFTGLSVVAYKTPWSILPFWTCWMILAGEGARLICLAFGNRWWHVLCLAGLTAWVIFCGKRNELLNGRYASGPNNPYVFSHTSPDAVRLADRLLRCADKVGRADFRVKAFHPEFALPLGWYLRELPKFGAWASPIDVSSDADVVIVPVNFATPTKEKLGPDWHMQIFGLRAGHDLAVFVRDKVYAVWQAAANPS